MPSFERGEVSLYYEEFGAGFPLLLFAPGGMRSSIAFWRQSPFDPTTELAADFRVIAMDQRNAGRSHGPITATDGWETYASDHLALLDHLGIQRCHVMGGCIGGSYCLGAIKAAPDRVSAAVLQNPIGLTASNRKDFYGMFDSWIDEMKKGGRKLDHAAVSAFRERMYGGDFVFNVSRDFVRSCATPMLILAGNDNFHPAEISSELKSLAPNSEIAMEWKTPATVGAAVARVRAFLKAHQPVK